MLLKKILDFEEFKCKLKSTYLFILLIKIFKFYKINYLQNCEEFFHFIGQIL